MQLPDDDGCVAILHKSLSALGPHAKVAVMKEQVSLLGQIVEPMSSGRFCTSRGCAIVRQFLEITPCERPSVGASLNPDVQFVP
eukprot:1138235-Amphidinium_carterae.1